jgi:diguanylate cyclase (GGDEF)-like protein
VVCEPQVRGFSSLTRLLTNQAFAWYGYPNGESNMEFRLYFQMFKRSWWMILLTMLFALAGALGASYLATPQYEAIARFIVSPSTELINRSDVLSSLNTLNNQSVMSTFTEVMSSDRIYAETLASLNLQPQDLKNYTYKATVISNSSVMEVSVTGPDAQMAANLANALGSETIRFVSRLNQVFTIAFLDIAVPPTVPSNPKPLLNSSLAVLLGLFSGILLAIFIEQIRLPLEVFRQRYNLDNMTGVYNRKYFIHHVENELAQKPEDVFSIGIVELSGISDLVETFPVASLQKVFQHVTDTLHQELRGNDIVGRWNEHSFIVMLPNTPGIAANRIFERIFQALSNPVNLEHFDAALNLGAQIGGAEYAHHITAQELFEMANNAIEQARMNASLPVYVWEMNKPPFANTLE